MTCKFKAKFTTTCAGCYETIYPGQDVHGYLGYADYGSECWDIFHPDCDPRPQTQPSVKEIFAKIPDNVEKEQERSYFHEA